MNGNFCLSPDSNEFWRQVAAEFIEPHCLLCSSLTFREAWENSASLLRKAVREFLNEIGEGKWIADDYLFLIRQREGGFTAAAYRNIRLRFLDWVISKTEPQSKLEASRNKLQKITPRG